MAYQVQYTPQDEYRYPPIKVKKQKGSFKGWRFLLTVVILLWLLLSGVPDFLIPGNPQVTRTAASEMLSLMKAGIPAHDAITAFCKQIIDGANF